MKKILISSLLTVVFALPAYSQMMDMPMMGHMEGHHGQMMEKGGMDRMDNMMGMCLEHAKEIGLTDDQIKKITPVHREMQKKQVRFKADLKIAEIELMEIMEVKDFDLDKAGAAVKKIADIKTTHHLDMMKQMKEVRSVLTEEQFQKMKKMMDTKMGMKMGGKKAEKRMKKHR